MLSAAFRLPAAVERTSLDSDGGVAGWRLLPQDEVRDARAMMEAGYDVSEWIPAVVPGAVFTSYVEAGIEPDPNFGDNAYRADRKKYDRNFWYRTELATEELPAGGHCWLCFEGANRRAEVYFNGERLGGLDGFMDRGRFEVTELLRRDGRKNVLAVLVRAPKTPIANHASPTYISSAGWDWMPYVPGLLNGITDDWSYSGTVKTDTSTDTQNNTISDSCFVLGAYSSLSQYIRGVVPGTYTISVRAKKTSTMSGYFYVTYNGNKTKYLFNKSTAFDWTDYSVTLTDVTDPTLRIYCYCRDASIYLADIMISEGAIPRKWTPAPNEIYTQEVKIDKRGIEVSNSASSQRTVITNTEFAGYYNDEVIFTLNKDETQTKKTTVDGELTVGKTKFVPMPTASEGLNIVILD